MLAITVFLIPQARKRPDPENQYNQGFQMVYFQTKIPIWVNFGMEKVGILFSHMEFITAFCTFYSNLVHFCMAIL
jgi:hypothetical protein